MAMNIDHCRGIVVDDDHCLAIVDDVLPGVAADPSKAAHDVVVIETGDFPFQGSLPSLRLIGDDYFDRRSRSVENQTDAEHN